MVAPSNDRIPPPNPDATVKSAVGDLLSAKDNFIEYVRATVARFLVMARSVVFFALMGVIGTVVGITTLAVATYLIVHSIAVGVGQIFGGQAWIGHLLVGLMIVGGVFAALLLVMKKMNRASRKKLVTDYEQRVQRN